MGSGPPWTGYFRCRCLTSDLAFTNSLFVHVSGLCLSGFRLDTVLIFIHVLRVSSVFCSVVLRLTIVSILCTFIPKKSNLEHYEPLGAATVLVAIVVAVTGAGMSPGRIVPLAMACDRVTFGTM